MESKTKHRILGILVVAGLIVLLLPFLQSNRELSANVNTVKAPPFPDQAAQSAPNIEEATPPQEAPTNSLPATENAAVIPPAPDVGTNQQPDEGISQTHTDEHNAKPPEISNPATQPVAPAKSASPEVSLNELDDESAPTNMTTNPSQSKLVAAAVASTIENKPEAVAPTAKVIKPKMTEGKVHTKHFHAKSSAQRTKAMLHRPIENDGLFKLKSAAYVVQLGGYQNKAQAMRLVNRLRAKGYHAFIQQFSSAKGEKTTEVFVGPENKQAVARHIASDLQTSMHIHGIVISYKPLAL